MKTPYDELPFIPTILAEVVCSQPYTGREWSERARDGSVVQKTEAARQRMTPDEVREFADLCEGKCRQAYEAGAKWFLKCVRAKFNNGRAQLEIYISHWLASYLNNPESLRRSVRLMS